ncbi:hypothetical protein [Saccharolobus shibatae]|uniref:hypothetical protein n=1 Tax=Saccharolobus shibatae TaxID=2286 RepID=UPI001FD5AE5E|nr:hypothetical protein [Saccharolobus shibatae]
MLNQSLNRNEYEILVAKNFKDDNIDNYLYNNKIKIFQSLDPLIIVISLKRLSCHQVK